MNMNQCRRFFSVALINSCCIFTGTIFVDLLLGSGGMNRPALWSLLLASAANGVLWKLCFSSLVFKKLSFGLRVLVFAATLFPVLSVIAVGFRWFPVDRLGGWVRFIIQFLVGLLVIFFVFELHFCHKGNKYNQQLDKYRAKEKER